MSDLTDFIGGSGSLWWDDIYDNIKEITVSSDFVVPTDVTKLTIGICGGGGGGNSSAGHGGGGGSGMTYHTLNVVPDETISVTIGAGGSSDNNGGDSTFGNYISVKGGGSGSTNIGGIGNNGGGNGGLMDNGNGFENAVSIISARTVSGVQVMKYINAGPGYGDRYAGGGAGGGYDYEGYGGSHSVPASGYGAGGANYVNTDGTQGICVVWY